MCKYEMDPASIVEDTERTWFGLQMGRQTDGRSERRTGGWTKWNQYTHFNFVGRGYDTIGLITYPTPTDMMLSPFCPSVSPVCLTFQSVLSLRHRQVFLLQGLTHQHGVRLSMVTWNIKGLIVGHAFVQCRDVMMRSFFSTNIHKRRLIARPLGQGKRCLLWIQHLIYSLSQLL